VYTALIGGYEDLIEQPIAANTDVVFVCCTDDVSLTSSTWDVRIIEPAFAKDPVRSARAIKIRGDAALDDFEETLWIDNRVVLTVDPNLILDDWLTDVDLALPQHSFRRHVVDEFEVVSSLGYDDKSRILEQLTHYAETMPESLLQPVLWTAIVARRKSPLVASTMRVWMDHVLRYSRRDQLSVVHAIATTGIPMKSIPLDNQQSPLHTWRPATRRQPRPVANSDTADHHEPSVALVGRLSIAIDEITAQFNSSLQAREQQLSALQALVDERDRAVTEMRRSRSWRVTAPLRRAGQVARALRRTLRRRRQPGMSQVP